MSQIAPPPDDPRDAERRPGTPLDAKAVIDRRRAVPLPQLVSATSAEIGLIRWR